MTTQDMPAKHNDRRFKPHIDLQGVRIVHDEITENLKIDVTAMDRAANHPELLKAWRRYRTAADVDFEALDPVALLRAARDLFEAFNKCKGEVSGDIKGAIMALQSMHSQLAERFAPMKK